MQQVQSRTLSPYRFRVKLQRDWELGVLVHFFVNWTNNSALEKRPQIHSNMDEKIHCLYKRNPFLKTAAKEKPPAGLMVWPAKLANVEMIIKWQHPRGPSIPNQSLQRMWQATCVPQGKSPFFQAIWHIIHRIFGSQLWSWHLPNKFSTHDAEQGFEWRRMFYCT